MDNQISILMGVYYRNSNISLLKRSVLSILDQSVKNIELVLCDDGSSLEARTFLDDLSRVDCRLILVRRGDLYSLPEKLNECLRVSRGKLIARMDDDDFSHSDRLEKQAKYLEAHPEIAFVGCNAALYRNGTQVGIRRLPPYPLVRDFYFTQPYLHPALMFRREALLTVSGYSEKKSCLLCEDYDLLLRLYEAGYKGANLEEVLLDYSLPSTAKGNRCMHHRWNEVITRYQRFRALGLLPSAFPWVIKPLAVGLLPEKVLYLIKKGREMC